MTELTSVKKLKLDLGNYRTTKQADERQAVEAIIAINPDWFWALTESLIETGYLPTENILVQKGNGARPSLIVKEGNRRVSALKLIHGYIPMDGLPVPQNIATGIENISQSWKLENAKVPCAIYDPEEADTVNRIRSLTHGKGEKAGRDGWTAVARARHNRDENGVAEPALDLLEKYLSSGKNLTAQQAQRWAGDYPLSVLEEAMKRVSTRIGASNGPDVAKQYPKIQHRISFDDIIRDIGLRLIGFDALRRKDIDIASNYGIPPDPAKTSPTNATSNAQSSTNASTGTPNAATGNAQGTTGGASANNSGNQGAQGPDGKGGASASASAGTRVQNAVAIHDPRQVMRTLRKFAPKGINREKVVSLLIEIKKLKLADNPIAFCFLLRSIFEISAKAYCIDHKADGLSALRKDGSDKHLIDVLRDVTAHLTKQNTDKEAQRRLHGALTEMAKPLGILSVTSMNQLVHNPKFAHQPSDIAILFGNVFPLLEAMNLS